MTQISISEVQYLAQLSSLRLTGDELSNFTDDLTNILNYVEQLRELNTNGVEPTYQVTGLQNIWRTDEVGAITTTTDQLLALAPEAEGKQVKVPKVL